MKKIFTLLLTLLIVLLSNQVKANDTLVFFGQNLPGAAQWSYKGGGTNLDAVPTWKTLAYAEPGWLTLRPQAFGFGVNPPVRNTAIPEDATAGGGGIVGARYPTLYFRKVVNVTAPQLASYINFSIDAKFDDAIIVWVNGVEAYRNNITTTPALYATLADAAIANNGADIYSATIPSSMFIAGNNIVAVEIHQSSLTSSDLFFDFQLIGNTALPIIGRPFTVRYNNASEKGNILFVANNIITTSGVITTEVPPGGTAANNSGNGMYIDIDNTTTNLFNLGSSWKWFSNGTRPASWETTGYSDAAWTTGNAELGYGDGDEITCLPYGCGGNICNPSAACTKYWTYYFRKTINITSLAGINQFLFNFKRDDGIVVYVNGTEVFRDNMPTGAIANTTPASLDITGVAEAAITTYTLNGTSPFVVGNNVIAVEVHQITQASSDITFDMSVDAFSLNNTFSSSTADLTLPSSCSEVLFAGLYWGATLGGTNSPGWRVGHDTVKLKIPGAGAYVNVVSTQTDLHNFGIPNAGQDHIGYSAFANITSLVNTTNANGTYAIANMVGPTGLSNCSGGWSIVIAYKDISDPITRNLVVFDGASFVTSSTFVDVPFAGFQTPVIGPVTADFGVICYDGDRNSTDGFFFKQDSAAAGVYLDMALAVNAISTSGATGDSWNSSISYLNSVVTTRNPAHNNTLGFDADIIRLNNPGNVNLNNNKTSARLRLNSGGERYYLQTITSAISVATPTIRGTITSADLNGGAAFAPNDSLRYNIAWRNNGSDTATNVSIIDTIPQNVTYRKNSLRINAIAKTDAIGDDEAEWDSVGNRVIFRIGTGATGTVGGQVLPNPLPGNNGTVSFDVNAINICALLMCNAAVSNRAFTYYTGKLSGDNFSDIIASSGVGCASALPIQDTIIGACYSQKDTVLNNRCLGTSVVLPTSFYPGYTFYRNMPFIPANVFSPPNTPITTTGRYFARILTKDGCLDTVVLRVRIVNCLDIDDDDDGIPDYVETMNALAFGDHDLDLIPNWNDAQYPGRVDYNGDLVDDRFDAGADADNDGVPNYYDVDFIFGGSFIDVNNDGVNDRYDTDLDGIINQYDGDSDNDGIPDVIESYGVDANGDGVIDNYSDTDGDGFSQNVDGSAGGTNASGRGLDYIDLDGDGKGNAIDLDSDNDGIPDITETNGTDTNNNGLVDGTFVDFDIDGFQDALDGDADLTAGAENTAGALLLSGADVVIDGRADTWPNKNLDRDFRPNAYDMDSDGDGIVDVIEAGLTDANFDGIADGVIGTNGWSATVSALPALNLRNTDASGNADYLDIDSDDDGIPDNIEGMSTAGYIRPISLTDTDGDGLIDHYDNIPASFGGAGIFVYDHDADGVPDYRDLDTDGDGQADIIEGNDFNLNGLMDDVVTLTGLDTDGDGLDNRFDSLNSVINLKGTSFNMGTGGTTSPLGDPAPGARCPVQKRVVAQIDRDWRYVSVVLPVQFLKFTGAAQNNLVPLSWTIIALTDVDHFEVERSTDNVTYLNAGNVTEAVKLNQQQSFGLTDDISAISNDIIYYRLKVIGKAGEIKYSSVLIVRRIPSKTPVTIMPNPANGYVTVNISVDKNIQATIILIDKVGRKILSQNENLTKGFNTINLKLDKFSEGVYAIIIETPAERIVKQLMIIR